jgi:lipoprotein-anchoring transpeptidase ErfK/SrfK
MLDFKFSFNLPIVLIGLTFLIGCNTQKQAEINPPINLVTQTQELSPLNITDRQPFTIIINRKSKEMRIIDSQNVELIKTPIGIGRGGFKQKTDMMDLVTPTGEMEVDLILYRDENFNQINPQLKEKYLTSEFKTFFETQEGLKQLFTNMNIIDFNGDKTPDNSYGIAYIGLNSAPNQSVVTGPKMRYANWQGGGNLPYWFSIALHGTPTENKDLGFANSGGCIHVSQDVLSEIIETDIITIGTKVIITDEIGNE